VPGAWHLLDLEQFLGNPYETFSSVCLFAQYIYALFKYKEDSRMKFKTIKTPNLLILGIGVVFLLVSFYFVGNYTYEVVTFEMTRWPPLETQQSIQYRLSPTTQEDLCHQLGFSNDDPFCMPEASWTRHEFDKVLDGQLLGKNSAPITFEEFDGKLSKYRIRCQKPRLGNDGIERFRCYYDIHPGIFEVHADFEDGLLVDIYTFKMDS